MQHFYFIIIPLFIEFHPA